MKVTVAVDGLQYQVEVGDLYARPVIAKIEGETFEVWPEGIEPFQVKESPQKPAALPAEKKKTYNGVASNTIVAPIPGIIFLIHVQPGDEVEIGQNICVLEAMKMKNVIRSQRAGRIAAVKVANGQQVAAGEDIVLFA